MKPKTANKIVKPKARKPAKKRATKNTPANFVGSVEIVPIPSGDAASFTKEQSEQLLGNTKEHILVERNLADKHAPLNDEQKAAFGSPDLTSLQKAFTFISKQSLWQKVCDNLSRVFK
jgi:hypothetical protein